MTKRPHHVVQHRSGMNGVEAMTMLTEHVFPRHSHDQFGIGVMTVGGQRSWSVLGGVESRTGDIIMVNPGEMHDGTPLDGVRGWHILYFDPALVEAEVHHDTAPTDFLFRPVVNDPYLSAMILRYFKGVDTLSSDSMATEEALLGCLMHVFQRHCIDGARNSTLPPPVALAVQRLEQEPETAISLGDLAKLSGVSRFQLLRGFFRETGATPHAYLIQLRVRLARRLLAAGENPAEAALMAGFSDQSHLTRAFVRQFGISPGRYKTAIS